jgi:hypothetical protein
LKTKKPVNIFYDVQNIFIIMSCANNVFSEGSCVISPDGFTWKINRIENNKYVAEGWQGNAWGNETSLNFGVLSACRGGQVIACPQEM